MKINQSGPTQTSYNQMLSQIISESFPSYNQSSQEKPIQNLHDPVRYMTQVTNCYTLIQ